MKINNKCIVSGIILSFLFLCCTGVYAIKKIHLKPDKISSELNTKKEILENDSLQTIKNTSVSKEDIIKSELENLKISTLQKLAKNPDDNNQILEDYLNNLQEKINELNSNVPTEIESKYEVSQIDKKTVNEYKKVAVGFACSEAMCCFIRDNEAIYQIFKSYLSAAFSGYLQIMADDDKQPYQHDMGITVPFEIIRKKMFMYDEFLNKYPDFIYNEQLKNYRDGLYYSYRYGLDNTPVICTKDEMQNNPDFLGDVKKSYANFLKEYPNKNSEYYKEIKECYNNIK